MRKAVVALQQNWAARDAKKEDPRPIDNRLDVGWGAFHDRLAAYSKLPVDQYPKAKRAQELVALLFPEGLTERQKPTERHPLGRDRAAEAPGAVHPRR
ncbi:MAG: hypothetical protein HYZ28_22535 [Myxococcales bacterium]|nr:hypothetical protein [Myxococcales bacterium]